MQGVSNHTTIYRIKVNDNGASIISQSFSRFCKIAKDRHGHYWIKDDNIIIIGKWQLDPGRLLIPPAGSIHVW